MLLTFLPVSLPLRLHSATIHAHSASRGANLNSKEIYFTFLHKTFKCLPKSIQTAPQHSKS